MDSQPSHGARARRPGAGAFALVCALGYAAYALLAKDHFFHLGGTAGLPPAAITREVVLGAVALAGVVAALVALRGAARRTGRDVSCAVAGLALLAPFVADALIAPLAPALATGSEREVAFHAMTAALIVGALVAGSRARTVRRRGDDPTGLPQAERQAPQAVPPSGRVLHGTVGHASYGAPSSAPAGWRSADSTAEPPSADVGAVLGGASAAARVGAGVASAAATGVPRSAVSRVGRPTGRLPARAALLLGALVAALVLGEGLARLFGLGAPPLGNPMLIVPGDERRVPLSEVALFRPTGPPAPGAGPSTRWRPYVFLKGWYDRPRWDYFDESDCVDYVFNRYGLRDHDFELAKQPGEYRVVAIGDSFTFGVGVQLEDCWTEQLERRLVAETDGPVEVINAGFTSGYHPTLYRPWIVKDGVELQPDVLIVGLCLNDMHPNVELYAYEVERPELPLGGVSRLLNAVQIARARGEAAPRQPLPFAEIVDEDPALWDATQAALRHCKAVLDAAGIRFVVVPFPMLSGLGEADYPYAPLLDMVTAFCDREGIEHVDLAPKFLGLRDEEFWVHPTDQHPNDRGHALIAEGIAEFLALP
ncbi:MAG: GDSL-type esterase/lipase family protein [Planctomycetota bacterium]|jgi:lysophospholipase L1-like esterase